MKQYTIMLQCCICQVGHGITVNLGCTLLVIFCLIQGGIRRKFFIGFFLMCLKKRRYRFRARDIQFLHVRVKHVVQ